MSTDGARRIATVALAIALLTGVAACGDSDGKSTATEPVDRIGQIDEASTTTAPTMSGRDAQHALVVGTPLYIGDYLVKVTEIRPNATEDVIRAHGRFAAPQYGQFVLVTFEMTYIGKRDGAPRFDLTAGLEAADGMHYPVCKGDLAASNVPLLPPNTTSSMSFCIDVPQTALAGGVVFIQAFAAPTQRARGYWIV